MTSRANLSLLALLLGLLILLPFSSAACGGGGGGSREWVDLGGGQYHDIPLDPVDPDPPSEPPAPPPPPTPPGSTTSQPRVPLGSTPPIGLTWNVGYTENATLTELQGVYSRVVSVNSALWNVTEGQVYIYRVVITDNVGPGSTPSTWLANTNSIATSSLDILIWPSNRWDLAGTAGFVAWSSPPQYGRTGLIMAVPSNASTHTWLHEAGHLIWNLSWSISFGLEDEYIDGIQDPACVMESTNPPQRWCSNLNHAPQTCQPHSCWHQILIDYGNYTHTNMDTASSSPWKPKVTYNNTAP